MIDFNAPPLVDVLKILLRGLNLNDLSAVKPRAKKNDVEKNFRTRSLAEVCSPSHLVKFMVNALDDENLYWQSRVDARWLEPACGEAPFITNRYDAETGEVIPSERRAGILDKKLRAIPADVDKNFWASRAVQSVCGFEIQPDSLLLARANVLLTFAEFVEDSSADELKAAAEVIAENFWLMDAFNLPSAQISLFEDATDWNTGDKIFFGGTDMKKKFDFLICNPPYQEEKEDNGRQPPVYHHLMNAARKISDKAVFITPARFLFNAGQTPKDFNRSMLDDPHFKVLDYAPDARKYFRGVQIEGGVAVTMRDDNQTFEPIGTFTPFPELNSLHKKICVDDKNFRSFKEIVHTPIAYKLSEKFFSERADLIHKLQKPDDNALRTNIFERVPEIFFDANPDDGHEYIQILGLIGSQRIYKWIRRDYVFAPALLNDYKVFVPESNGASGKLNDKEAARIISKPVLGEPSVGCTQTFISVGAFDTRAEAEACLKYIKSKFARAMLGILKATQHNPPATWAKVPLQDFTAASDIDWSAPVDEQLYRKYNLTAEEISFIESHVKEMA